VSHGSSLGGTDNRASSRLEPSVNYRLIPADSGRDGKVSADTASTPDTEPSKPQPHLVEVISVRLRIDPPGRQHGLTGHQACRRWTEDDLA
jgi:hypothetical protein